MGVPVSLLSLFRCCLFIDYFLGRFAPVEVVWFFISKTTFVHIANGQYISKVPVEEALEHCHSLISGTNESDIDPLTGSFVAEDC